MYSKLSSYLQLGRSQLRTGTYAWATLVGMLAVLKAFPPVPLILMALTSMLATALAVYVLNDISDMELDRISAEAGNPRHMKRPLVTGKATKRDAEVFVVVLAAVGLGIGLIVNFLFFSLISLFLVLGILYSLPPSSLGRRFLLKQLTVAVGQAISSLAGGAAAGGITRPVIFSALLFFTLTFGVVPINDLRDVYGDNKVGRKTFPVVVGSKTTIKLALAITVATLLASVLSYSWAGFNTAFPLLVASALFIASLTMLSIYRRRDDPVFIEGIMRRVMRPAFFILQTGILIGLIVF